MAVRGGGSGGDRQDPAAYTERRLEDAIRSLLRISERLNSTLNLDELLDVLVQGAIGLVGAESGVAGLCGPEGMFCRRYFQNGKELPLEYCWPPLHGLPGWLMVHKVPYLTNDAMTDTQIVHELCVQFGVRSALSTPILSADQSVLGFFEIHNKEGGFTAADRETLLAVSHSAAIAIQNALAYDRLQQAERTLRQSEERFARFMQHLPGLAWIKDLDGRYVFANDAAERAFRTPREHLYGKTDEEVFPAATAAQFTENDRRAIFTESGIQTVETLAHEDGVHHSFVNKFPILGDAGRISLVGGMAIDITERIRAEEELRLSEQRYRAVVESQAEMVCRFRADGTILFVNTAYARALGTSPEALVGRDFWNFIPPAEQEGVRRSIARLTPEAPEVRIENRFLARDGEKWTLWTNRGLTFDAEGRVDEAQSTGIDITERKRAEEALLRANADLEQFAYSASHDLQEPIRNISISTQILIANYGHLLDASGRERLSFVEESARRMSALVSDLLTYAQIASTPYEAVEPAAAETALSAALATLSLAIQEAGAVIVGESLPPVRVPDVQLRQLFQNLLSNAIKYRQEGVRPEVRIRSTRQGAHWLFAVQDNGIGIAPQYHERVFGLFKRLHGYGQYGGTGMGLAICQRIVERNGGRIWVESEGDNRGSTFCFTLPAA